MATKKTPKHYGKISALVFITLVFLCLFSLTVAPVIAAIVDITNHVFFDKTFFTWPIEKICLVGVISLPLSTLVYVLGLNMVTEIQQSIPQQKART